jgi:hypothetical protein
VVGGQVFDAVQDGLGFDRQGRLAEVDDGGRDRPRCVVVVMWDMMVMMNGWRGRGNVLWSVDMAMNVMVVARSCQQAVEFQAGSARNGADNTYA